ncbi:UNKNOWN [Stylonychia lemnae]|uniref:Uncharacterized protein n=1 Tax=Stylonychia lemnae TaxID=5949 RepID=A0A078A0L6_STYLE|nr:UNKNOWN [Stylonychia lemnae]|eukprot:CDW75690.1 UNKNOWN [Stylonychia lemnae]
MSKFYPVASNMTGNETKLEQKNSTLAQLEKFILKQVYNSQTFISQQKHDIAREHLHKAEFTLLNIEQSKDPILKTISALNLKNKLLTVIYQNFGLLYKQSALTFEKLNQMSNQNVVENHHQQQQQLQQHLMNKPPLIPHKQSDTLEMLHDQSLGYYQDSLKVVQDYKVSGYGLSVQQEINTVSKIELECYLALAREYQSQDLQQEAVKYYELAQRCLQSQQSGDDTLNQYIHEQIKKLRVINFSPSKYGEGDHSLLMTSQDQVEKIIRSKRGVGPKQGSLSIQNRVIAASSMQQNIQSTDISTALDEGFKDLEGVDVAVTSFSQSMRHQRRKLKRDSVEQVSLNGTALQNNNNNITNGNNNHAEYFTQKRIKNIKLPSVNMSDPQSAYYKPSQGVSKFNFVMKRQSMTGLVSPEAAKNNIIFSPASNKRQVNSHNEKFVSQSEYYHSQPTDHKPQSSLHQRDQSVNSQDNNSNNTTNIYGSNNQQFFKKRNEKKDERLKYQKFTFNRGLSEATKIYSAKTSGNFLDKIISKRSKRNDNDNTEKGKDSQTRDNSQQQQLDIRDIPKPYKFQSNLISPQNQTSINFSQNFSNSPFSQNHQINAEFTMNGNTSYKRDGSPYTVNDTLQLIQKRRQTQLINLSKQVEINKTQHRKPQGVPLSLFNLKHNISEDIKEETQRTYLSSQMNSKMINVTEDHNQSNNLNVPKTQRSYISTEDGMQLEDRMNKIALTIDKLNSQLIRYQEDLRSRKQDPLIKQRTDTAHYSQLSCTVNDLQHTESQDAADLGGGTGINTLSKLEIDGDIDDLESVSIIQDFI